MRENYLCVVYRSGLMQAPLMTVCTCTWLFEDLWALQKFKVTLTDSLNYMNWCVISSVLETGWASSFPPTAPDMYFIITKTDETTAGIFQYTVAAPPLTVHFFLFFVFFLKSNTSLCSTDGAGRYYGGNSVRGERVRGTQVERDTATLEEDVCFGGWPDGWGKRQATKGEVRQSGEDRREESGVEALK